MRSLVSSCGRFHSHQAAVAMYERDALGLYFTTYAERRLPADKIRRVPLIDNVHRALRRVGFVQRTVPLDLIKKQIFDTMVQRHVGSCDLLHLHSTLQPKAISRAHALGIPVLYDTGIAHPEFTHEILAQERAQFAPDAPPAHWPGEVERQVRELDQVDHFVVSSTRVRDSYVARGFCRDKLSVLPFGVDSSLFRPVPKADDVFRILTVGLLSLQKGCHYLLKGYRELGLPNTELVLVGKPRLDMLSTMAEYAGEYTHVPGIPHEQLYKTYSSASVFVLLSINEGFGAVVMEALACGVPVIISENVGTKDIVRDGVEGFVVPVRDTRVLRDHLVKLYEDPDLRAQMGEAARKRSLEYTWGRYGDGLMDICVSVAGPSRWSCDDDGSPGEF